MMDLPSPFKVPSVPGTPLYALSPERINQQRIPQSPSLPSHLSETERKHHRNSSDVRSKVDFLNSLAGHNPPPSPTRQNGTSAHAALQRAILGREEAEAQLSTAISQLQESQSRELRISQRVESLMEELQTVKERQVHERQVFEKEVRKARKEAFKASSVVVKAQENLKESRVELKTAKAEAQHERHEKDNARQEAFERAYALAGLMEEIEVVREKLKSVEQERDTALLELKSYVQPSEPTSTKAEAQVQATEVDSASGSAALHGDDVLPETEDSDLEYRILDLKDELRWEKTWREEAEQAVHMLQMECQFQKCACRVAEARGERFIHDKVYDERIRAISAERKRKAMEPPQPKPMKQARMSETQDESLEPISALEDMTQVIVQPNLQKQHFSFSTSASNTAPILRPTSALQQHHDLFDLSPPKPPVLRPATALGTMTPQSPIRVVPDSPKPRPASSQSHPTPAGSHHKRSKTAVTLRDPTSPLRHSARPHAHSPSFSATPAALDPGFRFPGCQGHIQTVSTTTTVPLRGLDNDDVFSPVHHTPGTPGTPVSREAALAQIRARRDRARSVNLKSTSGVGNLKGALVATPGSARRGINAVMFREGRRDVSQASAPGRI